MTDDSTDVVSIDTVFLHCNLINIPGPFWIDIDGSFDQALPYGMTRPNLPIAGLRGQPCCRYRLIRMTFVSTTSDLFFTNLTNDISDCGLDFILNWLTRNLPAPCTWLSVSKNCFDRQGYSKLNMETAYGPSNVYLH